MKNKRALLITQRDATDCGAACIASVCAYYNLHVPVSRIRQYACTSQEGTTIFGMIEALRILGVEAKGVKTATDSLGLIPLPCIAHIVSGTNTHFVVIAAVRKKGLIIMDPALGQLNKITYDKFSECWTGILILAVPSEKFEQGKCISNIRRFIALAHPHKKMLLQAIAGAVMVSILGAGSALYVQHIIDHILIQGNTRLLNMITVIMIVLILFHVILNYTKDLIAVRIGQSIDANLVLGYYKHLLHLPQSFFDTMRVGEIVSRVNDAIRISGFISNTLINIIVNSMIVVFSLSLMFVYYWRLALIAFLIIPLYIILTYLSDRISKKWQRKLMESYAALDTQLVESLNAAGTMKRFSLESFVMEKTEMTFMSLLKMVYRFSLYQLYLNGSSELVTKLFTILILWTGSYFVIDQQISPGELISFYALTGYFTSPSLQLTGSSKSIRESLIAADRLFEIIDLETEKSGSIVLHAKPGKIKLEDLHFSYNNREEVLKGVCLTIEKNSITGITGKSGSGKSTIANLLQKLYAPSNGRITIDETDIKYINNRSLREAVSVVPQQIQLFSASILENITIGDLNADIKKVLTICEKLGILEFIEQLPHGFDTLLSEQGNNLSGGQKQRISVARALYRDPPVLILDEATASLDDVSELKILEAVQWHRLKGNTVIIIAHRDAALNICDRVVTVEDGLVV